MIICNATPLINFAAINRLDILQAVFGTIVIPQAVYNETTVSSFPASQFILQAIAKVFLAFLHICALLKNIVFSGVC